MMKCSWPIFSLMFAVLLSAGHPALAQKRDAAGRQPPSDCFWKQHQFTRTLGTLRKYPDAELRFALANKAGEKPDYPVCYNRREQLRRDIQIDQWRRNEAPECLNYFRNKEAQDAKEWKALGLPPNRTLQQRMTEYNETCQQTAGPL
ncbi:hypothetical protein [Microvirga zambiensis]|uniref:hypothetical protein n=1 Tax=Microvirga zambiensis TaxID=1402137 RepID=UPI001AEF4111|nr:hypothetical protein [Microvirga zambiensis]